MSHAGRGRPSPCTALAALLAPLARGSLRLLRVTTDHPSSRREYVQSAVCVTKIKFASTEPLALGGV